MFPRSCIKVHIHLYKASVLEVEFRSIQQRNDIKLCLLFLPYWLVAFGHWAFRNSWFKTKKAHYCPSQGNQSEAEKTKQKALLNETNLTTIKRQSELSRFMPAKTKEAFIGLWWILVLWLCRNTAVRLYRDKLIVCLYLDCAVQDKAPLSTVTFICVRLIMEIL